MSQPESRKLRVPSEEQIEEWFESPVTAYLVAALQQSLDITHEARAECYCPGEPFRTQEMKAQLIGVEAVYSDIIDAIKQRDLSQLVEESASEERVGDLPVRQPGAH